MTSMSLPRNTCQCTSSRITTLTFSQVLPLSLIFSKCSSLHSLTLFRIIMKYSLRMTLAVVRSLRLMITLLTQLSALLKITNITILMTCRSQWTWRWMVKTIVLCLTHSPSNTLSPSLDKVAPTYIRVIIILLIKMNQNKLILVKHQLIV